MCCMKKDKNDCPDVAQAASFADEMAHKRILDEMPAYLRIQMFQHDDPGAVFRNYCSTRTSWIKNIDFINKLDEKEIVRTLAKACIDASPKAFLSLAEKHFSAWELSEEWRETMKDYSNIPWDAFVPLAACKLWRLWLKDRPSIETLDDWMQEGYTLWMTGHRARACDRWAQLWNGIRSLLIDDMRNTAAADKLLHGTQHIHDWLQDFLLELQNAAIDEPRFAHTGIDIINQVLQQFPDQAQLTLVNWRGDLGTFYFLADRFQDGEKVFQDLIRDFPDSGEGYVRFADILGFGPRNGAEIDLPRAIALVEEAIARPLIDDNDYDLQNWLNSLKQPRKKCCHGKNAPPHP